MELEPGPGDALLLVDVQNDFLPGGALPVPRGDEVIPALNEYIARFAALSLPVVASRDWHPENHCSFTSAGGKWPVHCVARSLGAGFAPALHLPENTLIVSKAESPLRDSYSAFGGTNLAASFRRWGVRRVFVGGLATEYCVRSTALDARKAGLQVVLLLDGIQAIDEQGEGRRAVEEMIQAGAQPAHLRTESHGTTRISTAD
jgi:nicotinamidase/pyrazinamidase